MLFSSRRSRGAGPRGDVFRSLIHWLAGSILAGSTLNAALPARLSQPYLATIAPLPLRFAPPPPDVSTEPAPAAPPNPDGIMGEVAQSNQEAVAPEALPPELLPATAGPEAAEPEPAPQPPAPAPTRAPVEIIPDDLGRPVMPEDMLPFFLPPQLPATPPSQAIYRQK